MSRELFQGDVNRLPFVVRKLQGEPGHPRELPVANGPSPVAYALALPSFRIAAQGFLCAAAIAARPAAEMPLRFTARFGWLAPDAPASFFFLRPAQYFFILTLTERRSAAVICLRPRRERSCDVVRLCWPSRKSGNARSSSFVSASSCHSRAFAPSRASDFMSIVIWG